MKIAVLSDIHGNLPALLAVIDHIDAWQPDLTVVDGDLINGGPNNLACLKLLLARQQMNSWKVLRGNHEEYVMEWSTGDRPATEAEFELRRLSYWTYTQLKGDVSALLPLPERFCWQAPDNSSLLVTHASVLGNRDGIYSHTPDDEVRRKISPGTAVFVTAHTHSPLVRQVDGTLVVNIGSVGLPADGDRRASYGQFTWSRREGWKAAIVRLLYDYEQAEKDFITSGFLASAGPSAEMSLIELRTAKDVKARWARAYERRVLSGELTMAEAVRHFLSAEEFLPFLNPVRTW